MRMRITLLVAGPIAAAVVIGLALAMVAAMLAR